MTSNHLFAQPLVTQLVLATEAENTKDHSEEWSFVPDLTGLDGGADGTRTRDLRRDSLELLSNEINELALLSII